MSILARLFRSSPDPREAMRPLWRRTVEIAREPEWYVGCGVADTVPGRFDMITAVLSLVLLRLEDAGKAGETACLTELFVEDMDGQLRESGVGDIVVGKHMGRLMEALGGRLDAYRRALPAGDGALLAQVAGRNVTLGEGADAGLLAERLRSLADGLAATGAEALAEGRIER